MDRRQFISGQFATHIPQADPSLELWKPSAENLWDASAAKHLFHRLGLAASKKWLDYALSMHPQQYIDLLMHETVVHELLPDPPDGWEEWLPLVPYYGPDQVRTQRQLDVYEMAKMDIRDQWVVLMMQQQVMLREKLTLFWSNHFVIQEQKVFHTKNVYRFIEYLREHAWGNFKQMVKDITIQPAMLVFLDGVWSEKGQINENYARELMELFTMGVADRYGRPNYTQKDVRDLALALTGWRFRYESPAPNTLQEYFAWYYFDYETKTSPWDAPEKLYGLKASGDPNIEADVLDTMFEMRGDEIAWFICQKLYKFFVYRDTSSKAAQQAIGELAGQFKLDWELKPVIERLIRSEHFFDVNCRGAIVKSPHDYMLGMMNQLGVTISSSRGGTMTTEAIDMTQWLLNPINVKGWPGHRAWLTSGTLTKRIQFANNLIVGQGVESKYVDGHTGQFYEWITWSDEEVIAWAREFESWDRDVAKFIDDLSDLLFAIPISDKIKEAIINRTITFPRYEWPTLTPEQRVPLLRRLALSLVMLPEYQIS